MGRAGLQRRAVAVDYGTPLHPLASRAATATMEEVRRFMTAHAA
jgi:hypothetical protein